MTDWTWMVEATEDFSDAYGAIGLLCVLLALLALCLWILFRKK